MFPSAEELRVVLTLLELADLILERRQLAPPPVESLRWAGRKPRSVASRRRRSLQTSSPPPPLVGKEKDAAAAAASSPTTPLSFQESGSEEADARPDPEAERRKRSRELSLPLSFRNSGAQEQEGVPLAEPGPEHGKRRWKSIAREVRKSFSNTSSSIFSNQSHQATKQREAVSIAGGAADPMALEHRWPAAVSAWIQPTVGDGHRGHQQSTRAAVGLPDLNASPTEEDEEEEEELEEDEEDRVWGWQQRQQQLMAYRAATSVARRRRVQIQREKRRGLLSSSFLAIPSRD